LQEHQNSSKAIENQGFCEKPTFAKGLRRGRPATSLAWCCIIKFVSVFQLKLLAVLAMVIDHIGLFFFPEIFLLRIIGRISFPIFAWLIAHGARRTRDVNLYGIRLLMLACVSQPLFYLVHARLNFAFDQQNVVFTLFFGLAAIICIRRVEEWVLRALIVFFFAVTATVVQSEYGAMGVLSIVFFYLFFDRRRYMILSQIFIYFAGPLLLFPLWENGLFYTNLLQYVIQLSAIFSLIFISFYNGKQGLKAKYLFYVFYPFQYVVIYFLQWI
jgi:hypothetical protein